MCCVRGIGLGCGTGVAVTLTSSDKLTWAKPCHLAQRMCSYRLQYKCSTIDGLFDLVASHCVALPAILVEFPIYPDYKDATRLCIWGTWVISYFHERPSPAPLSQSFPVPLSAGYKWSQPSPWSTHNPLVSTVYTF